MKNIIKIGILMLTLMIISGTNIFAQKNIDKAYDMMERFEYVQAVEYFQKHFVTNLPSTQNLRDISFCYLEMNKTDEAIKWLEKLSKKHDVEAYDLMLYAKILKTNAKYDEAIEQYQKIANNWSDKKNIAEKEIKAINKSKEWLENPNFFEVENMEKFNSEASEFGLILFNDEYILTSNRKNKIIYKNKDLHSWTGEPFYKLLLISDEENAKFKNIEELNSDYHNGPGVFDENYQMFYFTRTKSVKTRQKPSHIDPTSWYNPPSKDLNTNRLEIYMAEYINGKWGNPKAFQYNNANEYSVGHPAISKNGKVLYFSSDMPGGMGGSDIYFCERNEDGTWTKPQNAGNKINTDGKEVFPTISIDGKLHFSSDGHLGMGGLDIFVAEGKKDNWSKPENLKHPINSSKDDFSIIFTVPDEEAYFASNRDGGMGSDDIYQLKYMPPTNLIIAVRTYEQFDGNIEALPSVNVEIAGVGNSAKYNGQTDQNGFLYYQADCDSKYDFKAQRDGYFAQNASTQTHCETHSDTIYVDMVLERIIINKPIVLKNIYYDFDKWDIRADAAIELDKLVQIMIDNPEIIVELGSHTDSRGSFKYNETLSQRRAESAVEYIIANGIDSERITAKGYGESVLVNNCSDGVNCSEEEHQLNRRTEFKVTGYTLGAVNYEQ